ncbi:MAG: GatB/YqeY domain-containing protein [Bacillota bacterium]|nr:GatB/YqeY domain-containing protein [Bacillota bacterium]MDW7678599.1 GatB/YqeY domain-containing protein [Bacillota bacterium]
MAIREQLAEDLKSAMRNKETIRKDVVTMIRSSIKQVEVDERRTCSDDEVLALIMKQVKQRKDALEAFRQGQRSDLVEQTNAEITILESYLPEPLSEEELMAIVSEAVASTGAQSVKDMGKVMSLVMEKTKGKADGKTVNQLVRRQLSS